MTPRLFHSSDGVGIAVQDAGRPEGPPIVFVHGFAQSRGSWASLLDRPLAATHRLIAFDLRGHGDSDKPEDERAYAIERLGDDLHTVFDALALVRPVVVAWSYGGVVLGEYLRRHGDGALGGILLAAAAVRVGKPAQALFGPAMLSNARALLSPDGATYEAGARAFLAGCSASTLDPRTVEQAIAAMLAVPAHVRRALLFHSADYSAEFARCAAPIAVVHGTLDQVVLPKMSALVASLVTSCDTVLLAGVGHLSWIEAPDTFEAALHRTSIRAAAPLGASEVR